MKETDMNYEDLIDRSTFTFNRMRELSEEYERYERLYDRAHDFHITLYHVLERRGVITDEEYRCYMSWYKHSNLTAAEVERKVWGKG